MTEQNYANHSRFVRGYHYVLSLFLIIGTICSLVNIYQQWSAHYDMMNSILIALLFFCGLLIAAFTREFPLKAQDRAIRAEESLRYYILTHKQLNSKITMKQIIALRFAPDDEFVVLTDRAVKENLSPVEIKKEIKNWRADHHRV